MTPTKPTTARDRRDTELRRVLGEDGYAAYQLALASTSVERQAMQIAALVRVAHEINRGLP